MCYALLSHCAACSWTLNITYPRCTHALSQNLDCQSCPYKMRRKHDRTRVCGWCRTRSRSLSCIVADMDHRCIRSEGFADEVVSESGSEYSDNASEGGGSSVVEEGVGDTDTEISSDWEEVPGRKAKG